MATLTPLITVEQLRLAINPTTYMAIWDDENTGDVALVDASDAVALCLNEAHAMVVSYLGDLYRKIPDGTDQALPGLLVHAELLYARGISYDRHPEYTRTNGDNPRRDSVWKQAELIMKNVQMSVQRLVDNPPEPVPLNVGGLTVDDGQRVFIGRDSNGCLNSGDF